MSGPRLTFWFEFASTYSYPAAMRIRDLAGRLGVAVDYRPFLLGPIFSAQGWNNSPFNIYEAKGRYMWRDLARICEEYGLPFRKPAVFPQNGLLAARVALVGLSEGWGEDFVQAVYRTEFAEGRLIHDPAVIQGILRSLQRDPKSVFDASQQDAIKAQLRTQTEQAQRLGIFGAPSFTTQDGELFWGNDRLEAALAWASAKGA
ncbi:MAG: 2-hydroxychromene-2-carboxylate isomerase [Pseudorhodoplanes sp.]|jgi:2-hydroxychromene-2-carboxylate isomerase|nr:2-hydroxychromene-2-carboxylate isomerase [Pseudorhodoplanes sp.]